MWFNVQRGIVCTESMNHAPTLEMCRSPPRLIDPHGRSFAIHLLRIVDCNRKIVRHESNSETVSVTGILLEYCC